MMAVMTVTDLTDNTLENLQGDGQFSLREALEAINTGADIDGFGPTSGQYGTDDQILFAPELFDTGPQVIRLVAGQLELTSELVIAGPGQTLLTIDAQQNSRILDITQPTGDFTIAELTLTAGTTTGDNADSLDTTYSGGAIRSQTLGQLTLDHATITGNRTIGQRAAGGGVAARGNVTLTDSTIGANSTAGIYAYGGGLQTVGDVMLTRSTISGNQTSGTVGDGGGLYAKGDVMLTQSTLSGNRTMGSYSNGGGMYAFGNVTLTSSTISGNTTSGIDSIGGGIYTPRGLTVRYSTVTDNHALDVSATAGGLWNDNDVVTIVGSIVAGNSAGGGNPDMQPGAGMLTVQFSLIGDKEGTALVEAQVPDANGNLIGSQAGEGIIDARLGPLADHGGPTLTHTLLMGSPAINAGNRAFDPQSFQPSLDFDQRGMPFDRVTFGQIDLGALELDASSNLVSADFDGDSDTDGADFLVWQRGFGTQSGAIPAEGDATGDSAVRVGDFSAWFSTFGTTESTATISDPSLLISAISTLPAISLSAPALASGNYHPDMAFHRTTEDSIVPTISRHMRGSEEFPGFVAVDEFFNRMGIEALGSLLVSRPSLPGR
jgi:hypothetical protein